MLLPIAEPVFADPLRNAMFRQRIGNYQFDIATEPTKVVAGTPAKVVMRISGVNGDDLVDVPVKIRLEKDGVQVATAGPIVIQYGHYAYEYKFLESGKYVLYADLIDNAYSGQTLTFTFPLTVSGPEDYLFIVIPGVGAAGAAAAAGALVLKHRKKTRTT